MPFYRISEMADVKDVYGPTSHKQVNGEFMKVGIVTLRPGEEPEPHFHPNEEEFDLILEGRVLMVLGNEKKVLERGDLVHIPRNTVHGRKVLDADPLVFLNCKSPVGSGALSGDYNLAAQAAEIKQRLGRA
jgi:quercetin dioxygenase-like cupin family protein